MRLLTILVASLTVMKAFGGELAFITNQNASNLSIINLEQLKEIKRVDVPGKAAGLAVSANRVYTISPDDAVLREFSHEGENCRELQLDGGPIAVAVDQERKRAFVTDWYHARIFIVDLVNMELAGTLETGSAPSGIAISFDGRFLAVANRDANSVSLFDGDSLKLLDLLEVGERPFGVSFSEMGLAYITNVGSHNVSVIDPKSRRVIATIPTGERPYGVAFLNDRGFVSDQYQDQITVFDATNHQVLTTLAAGEYPEGIDVSQSKNQLYVANWFSNTLQVIDGDSLENIAEIHTGDGPRAFGKFVVEASNERCHDPL